MSTALAEIVQLRPADGASKRERLLERRDALMAGAARLRKVDQERAAVESRLTELHAERATIDAASAKPGPRGPRLPRVPPPLRTAEREDIAWRRGLLVGDLAAALNGQRTYSPSRGAMMDAHRVCARRALAAAEERASLVAIGEARGQLLTVKRELEATRSQRETLAAMRKALASPVRWR